MANIIYIGSIYPPGFKDYLVDMGSVVDDPADALQHAIINGLDSYYEDYTIITEPTKSSFPQIREWRFPTVNFSHGCGSNNGFNVGELNLKYLRLLSRAFRIRKQLKKVIKKEKNNVAIVYGLHTPFLYAVHSLRKYLSKIVVIVPDLPQYMSSSQDHFYRMAKSFDYKMICHYLNSVTHYVLLSEHMKEKLPIGDKPYTRMEGIYGDTFSFYGGKSKTKDILYTGKIDDRYGIEDLIHAFKLIKGDDYRLLIRGSGRSKQRMEALAEGDCRIIFLPRMSRKELLNLECSSTVLINPIPPSIEMTRYYFPSKTMEYMASGTPTVMYKLDCIPAEYDPHLIYIKGFGVEAIKRALEDICELPESMRLEFGAKASRFIKEKKNPKSQVSRIIELISE